MHNCKSTRKSLTDLALNEIQPGQKEQLLTELKQCAACREEYASIREALSISEQTLLSTLPAESFWAGYHDRLVDRLENHSTYVAPAGFSRMAQLWLRVRKMATASVRVPVPIAAAVLLLLFSVGILFAWNSRREPKPVLPSTQPPSVITQTVTVPVMQEKVVTRIVYVERNRGRSRTGRDQSTGTDLGNAASGAAQANRQANRQTNVETPDTTAISLVGFKPTDQVKLKIMKGSYRDEQ